MNRSETVGELAKALALAQGKMRGAVKDSENPYFKSKYADLASVVEAIRDALSENSIAYWQGTEPSEKDEVRVVTMLMHGSGEWINSVLALPVSKADAQGFGSALTYARRYGLCAATGVAPEEDDGNAAAKAAPPVFITARMSPEQTAAIHGPVVASSVCPVCGQDAIIKGNAKYGGGWVCWKNKKPVGGCGMKWPEGPFPTSAPADLAKPGIVSAEQAEKEANSLFPESPPFPDDERMERNALLGKIKAQTEMKKLSAETRRQLWADHCGSEASTETADVAALGNLLEAIGREQRA